VSSGTNIGNMAHNSKRVVVLGASGNLGSLIAKALGTRGAKLVSIVRQKSLENEKVVELKKNFQMEIIEGEMNDENLHKALKGAFAVVSALQGGPDVIINLQSQILEVAKKEHVKRFIPTDYSFDFFKLSDGDNINSDWRRKFAHHADSSRGTVEVVHVMNGCFLDVGVLFGFLGMFDLKNNQAFRYGKGDVAFGLTTYEDTASYTAEAALDDGTVPSKFYIAGDLMSLNQVIATYNEVTKKTLAVKDLGSVEDLHNQASARFKEAPQDMYSYLPKMYQYGMHSGKAALGELQNGRYPKVKPTTVKEYIQKHFGH